MAASAVQAAAGATTGSAFQGGLAGLLLGTTQTRGLVDPALLLLHPLTWPAVVLSHILRLAVFPAGLWLFSRKPIDPANTAIMREQAKKLGFDLSVLKKVQQEGCLYPSTATATGGSTSNGLFKPFSINLG